MASPRPRATSRGPGLDGFRWCLAGPGLARFGRRLGGFGRRLAGPRLAWFGRRLGGLGRRSPGSRRCTRRDLRHRPTGWRADRSARSVGALGLPGHRAAHQGQRLGPRHQGRHLAPAPATRRDPLSAERRFSGLGDPELNPNGLAQAEAAARRLSAPPYRLDVVVSSPLKRARRTAEAVAGLAGLDVEVDDDLRETDFGAWEGHTFTEIQRRWPAELAAWLADPTAAPPQGESFTQVARRVEAARDRLLERYEGRTVLVVSHVTPIKTLLRLALMAPPEALYRMHLDLACLSLIDFYADGPAVVKSFNDISHLR
ncbi:histidine phosphatase family protein [Nonomuraea recticatena]|uniref:histidine phosphatase family protein n=1 Tax=Nonomuraea recticatena TaxID=46178 RepID=UPI0036064291